MYRCKTPFEAEKRVARLGEAFICSKGSWSTFAVCIHTKEKFAPTPIFWNSQVQKRDLLSRLKRVLARMLLIRVAYDHGQRHCTER